MRNTCHRDFGIVELILMEHLSQVSLVANALKRSFLWPAYLSANHVPKKKQVSSTVTFVDFPNQTSMANYDPNDIPLRCHHFFLLS